MAPSPLLDVSSTLGDPKQNKNKKPFYYILFNSNKLFSYLPVLTKVLRANVVVPARDTDPYLVPTCIPAKIKLLAL